MDSAIRFLHPNPFGRAIGSIDRDLGYGVHETLVTRGLAEWHDDKPPSGKRSKRPVSEKDKA